MSVDAGDGFDLPLDLPLDPPLGPPPDLSVHGPVVIGATGGSGTRVVARVARRAGVFIGTDLNESEDSLPLAGYLERWLNAFVGRRSADAAARAHLREAMTVDLRAVLRRHRARLGAHPGAWGWKEPRSIFVLPFLDRVLPGLRFVHVVRDGRDMAFSANQNQLRKHGDAVLGWAEAGSPPEARSIALWAAVNEQALSYGEQRLGPRYLRIRFEDLCRRPEHTLGRMLEFLHAEADPAELAGEVEAPGSIGRWRFQEAALVAELERIAGPVLERLGYEVLAHAGGGPQ